MSVFKIRSEIAHEIGTRQIEFAVPAVRQNDGLLIPIDLAALLRRESRVLDQYPSAHRRYCVPLPLVDLGDSVIRVLCQARGANRRRVILLGLNNGSNGGIRRIRRDTINHRSHSIEIRGADAHALVLVTRKPRRNLPDQQVTAIGRSRSLHLVFGSTGYGIPSDVDCDCAALGRSLNVGGHHWAGIRCNRPEYPGPSGIARRIDGNDVIVIGIAGNQVCRVVVFRGLIVVDRRPRTRCRWSPEKLVMLRPANADPVHENSARPVGPSDKSDRRWEGIQHCRACGVV